MVTPALAAAGCEDGSYRAARMRGSHCAAISGCRRNAATAAYVIAPTTDGVAKGRVRFEQFDAFERRRLIGDLVRLELRARPQRTHDLLPPLQDRTVFRFGVNPMESITRRAPGNGLEFVNLRLG